MSLYESRTSYSWVLNSALVSLAQKIVADFENRKKRPAKTIETWSDFYTEVIK